jgi:hypothetical protein
MPRGERTPARGEDPPRTGGEGRRRAELRGPPVLQRCARDRGRRGRGLAEEGEAGPELAHSPAACAAPDPPARGGAEEDHRAEEDRRRTRASATSTPPTSPQLAAPAPAPPRLVAHAPRSAGGGRGEGVPRPPASLTNWPTRLPPGARGPASEHGPCLPAAGRRGRENREGGRREERSGRKKAGKKIKKNLTCGSHVL